MRCGIRWICHAAVLGALWSPVAGPTHEPPARGAGSGAHGEGLVPAGRAGRVSPVAQQPLSAVVAVDAYWEGERRPEHRRGAGVLATPGGYLFTPLFVVDGADYVIVSFGREQRSPARVVAVDRDSQLAVLRTRFVPREIACPVLSGDEAERADTPVVMVSPEAVGPRAIPGSIVGARERVGGLRTVLEVDLREVPDTVGGVLLNARGSVVGLVLATRADDEAADPEAPRGARVFALPSSEIRRALDRIVRGLPEAVPEPDRRIVAA